MQLLALAAHCNPIPSGCKKDKKDPSSVLNIVNAFTQSCTCLAYIQTGRTCACFGAVVALENEQQILTLKEHEQPRALWQLVRRQVPHTLEEHARFPTGTFIRSFPPKKQVPMVPLSAHLRHSAASPTSYIDGDCI